MTRIKKKICLFGISLKHNNIRITVFPLDDKFVFGDILFFWLIFSNFLRNERRGVLVRAAAEAGGRRLGQRREAAPPPPPLSGPKSRAAHSAKTL